VPALDPALQASHGDESVIEEISRALRSANSRVRNLATLELELLNNPLAVDPLGACLVKYHSNSARRALGKIGDIRGAEYMYAALNADDAWWQPRQEKMGTGDHVSDNSWVYVTVYPYKEEMVHSLGALGGQKLVIRTFVRLAEDPESRRRDAAADALLLFAREGGAGGVFANDPESRNMMIDAAHRMLQENATRQATASQILRYLEKSRKIGS
jgi:HEAT repeat protein